MLKLNLKDARTKHGLTQKQVSLLCGISVRQWQRVESGKCLPNALTAIFISNFLHLPFYHSTNYSMESEKL